MKSLEKIENRGVRQGYSRGIAQIIRVFNIFFKYLPPTGRVARRKFFEFLREIFSF